MQSDLERHMRRFRWLTRLAIGVSFVHMAGTLLMFAGDEWYDKLSAIGMILLVDLTELLITEYIFSMLARGRKMGAISPVIWLALSFGLILSCVLNGAYLVAHAPAVLKPEVSTAIAVVFALFIPLAIGAGAVAQADLAAVAQADDQTAQAAQAARTAAAQALADARTALAQAQAEAAGLRTQLAQACAERDAAAQGATQQGATFAHYQQAAAQATERAARAEADVAGLRAELATLSQAGGLDKPALVRALRAGRVASWREIEQLAQVAASTARGWVSEAQPAAAAAQ